MKKHKEYFDFSDYSRKHFCFDMTNKKIIGLFTDELNSLSLFLEEFIGLRPKSYSLKYRGQVENNIVVNKNLEEYNFLLKSLVVLDLFA